MMPEDKISLGGKGGKLAFRVYECADGGKDGDPINFNLDNRFSFY